MTTTDAPEPAHALRVRIPETGVEVGPFQHLADERERLASLRWEHFSARLLGATIGAELSGVRLGPDLADEVIAEIRQALLDYKVIVFRDQAHLRAEDQVAFASRFGDLEVHPFLRSSDERPELVRFEKSPEFGGYENSWHLSLIHI